MKTFSCLKNLFDFKKDQLDEKDTIEIGEITIKVLQIVVKGSSKTYLVKQKEKQELKQKEKEKYQLKEKEKQELKQKEKEKQELKEKQQKQEQEKFCRICYGVEQHKDNQLLNVCKCQGSMQYIHLECLRSWVEQKLKVKQIGENKVLYWDQAQCEICHQQLEFVHQGCYHLYNIQEFLPYSYVILQAIHKEINKSKAIFIIKLKEHQIIRLGKGQKNDIRIISEGVSEQDCYFEVKNQKLYFRKYME